jgi:hypothetical protein
MKSDIAISDPTISDPTIHIHEASFFDKKSKSGSEWVFIFLIIVFCHFNGNE